MPDDDVGEAGLCQRRTLLLGALALAPWLVGTAQAQDATEAPPQPGDHLVFLTGPKKGEPIRSDDIVADTVPVQAYPADPGGVVRDGSRLNLVILARVGTDGLSDETRARAADGVVAYSGVCTHQSCPVNMWAKELEAFVCSCHGSTYNPKDGAEVMAGPAPRRLPALPLKSVDGVLMVAAGFTGRIGLQPG